MAFSGGRLILNMMLAPQVNITMVRPKGITDHTISSARPECTAPGSSCSERRRYLIAKTKIATKISTVKKIDTARRKYVRWSTSGANVDACSGNKASLPIANVSTGLRQKFLVPPEIAAEHDQQEHPADQRKCRPREPDHVHRDRPVLPRSGVVVEAVQQQGVHRAPDFVFRRLHQPQPDVARRILDPVEILRQAALRSGDHDTARVRVL